MENIIIDAREELENILTRYCVKKASEILILIEENKVPAQIAFQEYLEAHELEKIVSQIRV